jgi:hypothetical protein
MAITGQAKRERIVCKGCGAFRPHADRGLCRTCFRRVSRQIRGKRTFVCAQCGRRPPMETGRCAGRAGPESIRTPTGSIAPRARS